MGAAASSEAALKRTLIVAFGPAASYARLPRNPRQWTKEQVAVFLREKEMPGVADQLLSNDITGEMLLQEENERDIVELVGFPPLRRKLLRSIVELRQKASDVSAKAPDLSEASVKIQSSLDQLNETMRALEQSLLQEVAAAEGQQLRAGGDSNQGQQARSIRHQIEDTRPEVGPAVLGVGDDAQATAAAVKIQARARGNMTRERVRRKKAPPKSEAEQEAEAMAANEMYQQQEIEAATRIQAVRRGYLARRGDGSSDDCLVELIVGSELSRAIEVMVLLRSMHTNKLCDHLSARADGTTTGGRGVQRAGEGGGRSDDDEGEEEGGEEEGLDLSGPAADPDAADEPEDRGSEEQGEEEAAARAGSDHTAPLSEGPMGAEEGAEEEAAVKDEEDQGNGEAARGAEALEPALLDPDKAAANIQAVARGRRDRRYSRQLKDQNWGAGQVGAGVDNLPEGDGEEGRGETGEAV